jgi:hypothetical protein
MSYTLQELTSEQKLKAHGIYYFVPGFLRHFDTEAVISLIAPRPILFLTGDEDIGSPVSGSKRSKASFNAVYKLNKAERRIPEHYLSKDGHVYTPDMWDRMTKWMGVKLK